MLKNVWTKWEPAILQLPQCFTVWFILWTLVICVLMCLLCWNRKLKCCETESRRVWFLFWFEHFIVVCASGRAASLQGGLVRLLRVPFLCGRIHKLNKYWGRVSFTSNNERRINPIMYKGNTRSIRLKRISSLKEDKFKFSSCKWDTGTVNYSTSSW